MALPIGGVGIIVDCTTQLSHEQEQLASLVVLRTSRKRVGEIEHRVLYAPTPGIKSVTSCLHLLIGIRMLVDALLSKILDNPRLGAKALASLGVQKRW